MFACDFGGSYTCSPSTSPYSFPSLEECQAKCKCTENCSPDPNAPLPDYDPNWLYSCDGVKCVQSADGKLEYLECIRNGPCAQKFSARYKSGIDGINGEQECYEDVAGRFSKQECEDYIKLYWPPTSVCPTEEDCDFVGKLYVLAGMDMNAPQNGRPFYNNRALQKNATDRDNCVSHARLPTPMTTNEFSFNSVANYNSQNSKFGSADASYQGGVYNAHATFEIGQFQDMQQSSEASGYRSDTTAESGALGYVQQRNPDSSAEKCLAASNLHPATLQILNSMGVFNHTNASMEQKYKDLKQYRDFLQYTGSHVLTQVVLGSTFNQNTTTNTSSSNTVELLKVNACLGGGAYGFDVNGCGGGSTSKQTAATNLQTSSARTAVGGSTSDRVIMTDPRHVPNAEETANFFSLQSEYQAPLNFYYSPIWDQLKLVFWDTDPYSVKMKQRAAHFQDAFYLRYAIVDVKAPQTPAEISYLLADGFKPVPIASCLSTGLMAHRRDNMITSDNRMPVFTNHTVWAPYQCSQTTYKNAIKLV